MKGWILASLGAMLGSLATTAAAQHKDLPEKKWTVARTPDGQPSLEGIWIDNSATPLERPKELEGKQFLTDAEVAELKQRADRMFNNGYSDFAAGDNFYLAVLRDVGRYKNPGSTNNSYEMVPREFDNRTSLIIDPPDGRIPPMTPEGKRRMEAGNAANTFQHPAAGPQDLSSAMRCITPGVPRIGGRWGAGNDGYYEFFQSRGYVIFFMEAFHDARIISLDGRPHLPPEIRSWNGDSRGHWEGNTLVVDTTNFSAKTNFMGSSDNLHLVERFTRVSPDVINYEVRIEDAATWTKPWTVLVRLKKTHQKLYEYACHEGNLPMIGTLSAARAQEKAAEEAAAKNK
jgi:hypothetical protein